MRKFGKYEKMPDGTKAKQPTAKSVLLQTYFTSLICMVLCVAMFFGTTFAWFTSEVNNSGNEIYIGTLDVGLFKQDGTDLSQEGKLFDGNIRWEPGYTTMETITIKNEGNLAFRYALTFTDGKINGAENAELLRKVAKHFVVYIHPGEFTDADPKPASFADIKASAEAEDGTWRAVRMGKDPATLADILEKGFPVLSGNMEITAEEDTYVLALHMKETAGEGQTEEDNLQLSQELMGKCIELNVKLTAYQRTHEEDAFGAEYDLQAHVTDLGALDIAYSTWITDEDTKYMTLDTAYQFQPVESYEEALSSPHRKYIADFTVWADKDVKAGSMALAGYYNAWCTYNKDRWIALQADTTIPAGEEIRLVQAMGSSFAVTYEMLCEYGNDGIGFLCGAKDLTGENAGTTLTVELRIHEVVNGTETGNYTVAGRYTYTFPNNTPAP